MAFQGIKTDINELAAVFGLPDFDSIEEANEEFLHSAYVVGFEDCEEEVGDEPIDCDGSGQEAREIALQELFSKWSSAVIETVNYSFDQVGLIADPAKKTEMVPFAAPFDYLIFPTDTWENAAEGLRRVVDGVGMFFVGNDLKEFLEMGPWTARQAVEGHWKHARDWMNVYEGRSPMRLYEAMWR